VSLEPKERGSSALVALTVPPKCRLYLRMAIRHFLKIITSSVPRNDCHVYTLLSAQPDAAAVFKSLFVGFGNVAGLK
jgi:hypothetical protein